jgi:hypothetical protein
VVRSVCKNEDCPEYGVFHYYHGPRCIACDGPVVRLRGTPFCWWVSLALIVASLFATIVGISALGVRL